MPEASLPGAVEICSERSAAGIIRCAERDAVVRQEDDLQLVAHARVGVDLFADRVDRLDDALGQFVTGRGLGAENKNAWLHIEVRILQDAAIEREDMKQVQVLALVFMQPLDLDIEERGRIDRDAAFIEDDLGQANLVGMFHRHEFVLESGIVGPLLQPAKLVEISRPTVADFRRDQIGQERIGGKEPAAGRNAVGLVLNLDALRDKKRRSRRRGAS